MRKEEDLTFEDEHEQEDKDEANIRAAMLEPNAHMD